MAVQQVVEPATAQNVFVISYQEKTLEKETVEKLRLCETPAQLTPILRSIGYESKQYDKDTTFIFSKNTKLDNYIFEKEKLMDYFVQEGVGRTSKPLEKITTISELPQFWQDEVNVSTKTSSNTSVKKNAPIIPVLYCKITLKFGEKEVSTSISMERMIPKTLLANMQGLASVEGGVTREDKRLPATLEEAVGQFPYVSFTLNGLITKTWGHPISNSQAAQILEAYFKELRLRSETSEEKLRRIYREFFKKLEGQDPMWKELNDLNGRPAKSMSKEISKMVENNLFGDSSKRFLDDKDIRSFLSQAVVVKTNPVMNISVPKLNHNGAFNFIMFVL